MCRRPCCRPCRRLRRKISSQKPERAKQTLKYAIAIPTGIGFCAAVAVQFAAEPVVSLFTSDLAVIRAGGQYFRGYVWDSCIGGIQFSFSGYFCACGRSELSFLHNIISMVFVRIPGAFSPPSSLPTPFFPWALPQRRALSCRRLSALSPLQLSPKRRRPHRQSPKEGGGMRLFQIGEMAKLFHLSVSSIRHYEDLGLILPEKPTKTRGIDITAPVSSRHLIP